MGEGTHFQKPVVQASLVMRKPDSIKTFGETHALIFVRAEWCRAEPENGGFVFGFLVATSGFGIEPAQEAGVAGRDGVVTLIHHDNSGPVQPL